MRAMGNGRMGNGECKGDSSRLVIPHSAFQSFPILTTDH
jgi:hypothetical protein